MSDSMRTQIAQAMVDQIKAEMPELRYCDFGRPKITAGDFNEYELPAVQLIGGADANVHEQRRGVKTWMIMAELVIGPIAADNYAPTQTDLWNLMEKVEQAVMSQPKLGLAPVKHVKLLGSEPDLALLHPLFSGRIEFAVEYYQALVGPC